MEWISKIGYRSFAEAEAELMITQYNSGYYSKLRPHKHNGGIPSNKTTENYWLAFKNIDKILSHSVEFF